MLLVRYLSCRSHICAQANNGATHKPDQRRNEERGEGRKAIGSNGQTLSLCSRAMLEEPTGKAS